VTSFVGAKPGNEVVAVGFGKEKGNQKKSVDMGQHWWGGKERRFGWGGDAQIKSSMQTRGTKKGKIKKKTRLSLAFRLGGWGAGSGRWAKE